jgi:hypothetical protein
MDSIRRAIATFSIVAILSSFVVSTASAASFGDVAADDYYYDAVESLVTDGIVDPGDTYNPAAGLTRALAAKYLVMGAGWEETTHTEATFTDVPKTHPQFDLIETAVDHGFMNGYGGENVGTFGPSDVVNRADFSKMAVAAFELPEYTPTTATFSDVATDAYYFMSVETAAKYEVVSGYGGAMAGMFGPADTINRADGATLVNNAQTADLTEDADDTDDDTDDDVVYEGDLEVSLSDDSPDPDTLPDGATSVEIVTWDFTATGGDVELDQLLVHTYGVTSLPNDHNVYLYEGTSRLTSGKTVNSSTNIATFNNLGIEIESGDTMTISLRLSTGSVEASTEAAFELEDVDAVDAGDAEVDGDFPIKSGVWTLSTIDAGTLKITKNGTPSTPKVGEDDAVIAKFKMDATTEAAELEQLGFLLDGTISSASVANFELYVSGEDDPIATVDSVDGNDRIVFILDDAYEIGKGETKSFTIVADFNTGRSADIVKVYVDETTDILAVGGTYGYGMSVDIATNGTYDGTSCTTTDGNCTYLALEGGDVTVTSSGPSADTLAIGANDVTLLTFSISSVSDVTVKNWPMYFVTGGTTGDTGLVDDSSTAAANYTDMKIINADTGDTLMGPIDSTSLYIANTYAGAMADGSDDDGWYLFTDEFDMDAGEELNLAVTTDITNLAGLSGDTIYAAIELGATNPIIKDVNNKTVGNSTALVPASTITGKTMTISSPSLTLSLASTPVSDTYVKGSKDVAFAGVAFACGAASDCEVLEVTLQGYIDDDDADDWAIAGTGATNSTVLNSVVGSVWLEDEDGELIAAAAGVESDGDVIFSNMGWDLEAGETAMAYLVGNINNDAYKDDDPENIAFGIAAVTDVTYEDNDGTSRNPTGTPNSEGTGATTPTTYVTVSNGGSLTIAVDSGTAKENIVVAGTADVETGKFKFTTTDEGFVVKELSINARQSGATTATMGDYDNNISSVKVSYTNSDGDVETKTGYLTNGTANFTGLDFFIEKDEDALLTVSANLNTISGGATAAEFVDLNVAFNAFEAVAQSSGETYSGAYLDITYDATMDLDFGSITWTDSGAHDINVAVATLAGLGSSQTIKVDDTAAATPENLPAGTLLCVSTSTTCSGDAILVVNSWTEGSDWTDATDGDTVVTTVLDNADTDFANDDNIVYALPGSGYLTGSNHMHVYETKPTITLATSSATGSRNVAASDDVMKFTIEANGQEEVVFRAAQELSAGVGVGTLCTPAADVTAGDHVDTSGQICTTAGNTATDTISFATSGTDLSGYARANFWVKWTDVGGTPPQWVDLAIGTGVDADTNSQETVLSQTICGADGATMITTEWYNCDVVIHASTEALDDTLHFVLVDATRLLETDTIHIDRMLVYNEKMVIDVATDTDLDTYANNTSNADAPSEAFLKDGGDTIATGYWSTLTNGAGATTTASAVFIPTTEFSVAKGTSKTLTLNVDTSDLLAEDAAADDPVTFSFGLGTSSAGNPTAGDIWWYDTNATVKWLGYVNSTTINGNTLTY